VRSGPHRPPSMRPCFFSGRISRRFQGRERASRIGTGSGLRIAAIGAAGRIELGKTPSVQFHKLNKNIRLGSFCHSLAERRGTAAGQGTHSCNPVPGGHASRTGRFPIQVVTSSPATNSLNIDLMGGEAGGSRREFGVRDGRRAAADRRDRPPQSGLTAPENLDPR